MAMFYSITRILIDLSNSPLKVAEDFLIRLELINLTRTFRKACLNNSLVLVAKLSTKLASLSTVTSIRMLFSSITSRRLFMKF